jgi:hypothetical protein
VKTVWIEFHGAKIVFSSQTLAIATIWAQKLSNFEREISSETQATVVFYFLPIGLDSFP